MPDTQVNAEIFAPLQDHIHATEYTDADLLGLIGDTIADAPAIARAYSLHARDVLAEFGHEEMSYSHVIAHVYWRTYFSPEHAARYGTAHMVDDPTQLSQFAQFLIDPSKVTLSDAVATTPLPRH